MQCCIKAYDPPAQYNPIRWAPEIQLPAATANWLKPIVRAALAHFLTGSVRVRGLSEISGVWPSISLGLFVPVSVKNLSRALKQPNLKRPEIPRAKSINGRKKGMQCHIEF